MAHCSGRLLRSSSQTLASCNAFRSELCQPPLAVLWLGIIAVALAEVHGRFVLPGPAIPVVQLAEQTPEDQFLVAVDVGGFADDGALFGTVVAVVKPDAGLVQRLPI